ncbi:MULTISPECIES: adenylate/guanylate cyclase domain-containing protein [Bradyrhizobium]|jgi:class 3 adenylate cyclase/tetratricopeptide (TPR) repeat protein|uniref:ATP-binding protein n=1 Tax=Bradyrhizobium TaxID=374 RepID=UPI000464D6B5|nr:MULTISPECIES: adenylate/guanylate cyclase domain-containing protein [Bradyrhizobium]KIU43895.1 ATPase [Bradyrhizobium elkanii]MBK5652152.1 AAA family ATPase [Rhizobium sp.]OCX27596.1 ATPase [Bradyrhizobium sp. UASWS1016]
MLCFACQSAIGADDSWCAKCGAAVANRVDPDSEQRFVTILRADVVDSTGLVADLEPEAAVSRLEPALAAMRSAVRQFGGIVSKELGDGLSAVFGAPIADDNHAPLACHAAIELVRRVAGLGDAGLQVRVGLHSGRVVAYMVASEYSKVYEIGGVAQHLAARLEAVAGPNQIYASEACQNLAEGNVQFEYLGRQQLKGFSEPLPVYRVTGAADVSSWRVRRARRVARFVNRVEETALLKRLAHSAGPGRQTAFLIGEPGIGKSRLVHEFVDELQREGWRPVHAECSPNLQGAPFSALKALMLSILADDSTGLQSDLTAVQRSAIDAVLDRPISDPEWAELEPHARGRAIIDASCTVVESVVLRQRTVILIEDLHWIDRASEAVMAALASLKAPGLLMLLTSRPNGIPDWIERCNAEIAALRSLGEDAGREMLDDILGLSENMTDLKSRVVLHTASVPLFIEEVCRSLKDSGILRGHWGDLALARPVGDLGIPSSIQGVIATRLDRVSKEERSLLQIAAAIGPHSTESMLREIAGLPGEAMQRCLEALDRAEFLVRIDAEPDDMLEFPHEMIRQVTYDSMVEKVRESVHARILATLESSGRWHDEPNRLCYHATRAKDWQKAFTYGRAAARRSLTRSAFAGAASYFETAMTALDKMPFSRLRETDAVDLRIEARVAFMWSGKVAESFDLGKEAERRADAIGDIGRKVAAMTMRSGTQNFYGTPVEAIATGEAVVGLAGQWGNSGWINLAQYTLGQAYFIAGRLRDAEQMLGQACVQLSGPDASAPPGTTPKTLLLLCCMMKSVTHTTLGEIDTAIEFHQRAMAIANESNRPFDRVGTGYSGGFLMLGQGNPAGAAGILEEAFAVTQKYGIRLFAPVVECHLGIAYLEQGRFAEARKTLTDAREEAKSVGYTSIVLRTSIYLAQALSRLGDVPAALGMLREARNTARQQGFSGLEAEALLGEAAMLPASNEAERSSVLHQLRAAIGIASDIGAKPLLHRAETALNAMLADSQGNLLRR